MLIDNQDLLESVEACVFSEWDGEGGCMSLPDEAESYLLRDFVTGIGIPSSFLV